MRDHFVDLVHQLTLVSSIFSRLQASYLSGHPVANVSVQTGIVSLEHDHLTWRPDHFECPALLLPPIIFTK